MSSQPTCRSTRPAALPQPIPSNVIPEIAIAIGLVIATELLSSAFLMLASLLASVYVGRDYRGESTRLSVAFAVMSRRAPVALAVWFLSTALGFGILALAGLVAVVAYVVFPPAPGTVGGLGALVALIAIVGGAVGFAIVVDPLPGRAGRRRARAGWPGQGHAALMAPDRRQRVADVRPRRGRLDLGERAGRDRVRNSSR